MLLAATEKLDGEQIDISLYFPHPSLLDNVEALIGLEDTKLKEIAHNPVLFDAILVELYQQVLAASPAERTALKKQLGNLVKKIGITNISPAADKAFLRVHQALNRERTQDTLLHVEQLLLEIQQKISPQTKTEKAKSFGVNLATRSIAILIVFFIVVFLPIGI